LLAFLANQYTGANGGGNRLTRFLFYFKRNHLAGAGCCLLCLGLSQNGELHFAQVTGMLALRGVHLCPQRRHLRVGRLNTFM
jgi:hypothetical protein